VLYDAIGHRRKELAILTVAGARGARYEWHQHVDIAREKGVTLSKMRAIGGGDLSPFDDAEYVLLQYARAVESGTVTDRNDARRGRKPRRRVRRRRPRERTARLNRPRSWTL